MRVISPALSLDSGVMHKAVEKLYLSQKSPFSLNNNYPLIMGETAKLDNAQE